MLFPSQLLLAPWQPATVSGPNPPAGRPAAAGAGGGAGSRSLAGPTPNSSDSSRRRGRCHRAVTVSARSSSSARGLDDRAGRWEVRSSGLRVRPQPACSAWSLPSELAHSVPQCCQRQPGSLRGLGKFIARRRRGGWQLTLPVGVDRSQAALMVALERPATVTGTPTQPEVSLRSGQILKV